MNDSRTVFLPRIRTKPPYPSSIAKCFKSNKNDENKILSPKHNNRQIVFKGGPLLPVNKQNKQNTQTHHPVASSSQRGHRRHGTSSNAAKPSQSHRAATTSNIMFDSRICRGNTYAKNNAISKRRSSSLLVQKRKKQERRRRNMTPPAVQGRVHVSSQTDISIEELCMLHHAMPTSNYSCASTRNIIGKDAQLTNTTEGKDQNNNDNDTNETNQCAALSKKDNRKKGNQQKIEDNIEHFAQMMVTNAKTQAIEQYHIDSILLLDDQHCYYHSEDESNLTRRCHLLNESSKECNVKGVRSCFSNKNDKDEKGQLDVEQNARIDNMKRYICEFARLVVLEATQNMLMKNTYRNDSVG